MVAFMKILMVTPFYYPIIGGTENLIKNISIKLNEMEILTDVMTFNVDQNWKPWSIKQIRKGKTEKLDDLNIIKIPALTFLPTRIMFQINFIPGRFANRFNQYDLIHFHNDVDLTFPMFSQSIKKPKIFHFHCLNATYSWYRKNPLSKTILKRIAELYIVPSFFDFKMLVNLGIPKTKIKRVPNGIDVQKFHPIDKPKIENLLLFVGRIHPNKGLPVLLNALRHLETSVHLVIIGPPSKLLFFKRILAQIRMINETSTHKVTYLGSYKSQDELINWYQKASVFVCPSLSEPFGIVNLEAMACATPVVTTNVGGIPEVVKNYENGILVQPNDSVNLASAIQYLLDNEETRRKFGKTGRNCVVKLFSSGAVAERFRQIYANILEKS